MLSMGTTAASIVPHDANGWTGPVQRSASPSPSPSSSTTTTTASSHTATYELVAQHALPSFDPSITFKQLFFTKEQVLVYNKVMFKNRWLITVLFNCGAVLTVIVLVVPPLTGQILAPVVPLIQWLGLVSVFMPARPHMWPIIIRTYDFWMLTIWNVVFMACFAVLLGDVRVLALLVRAVVQQGAIMTDAVITSSTHLAAGGMINTFALLLEGVLIGFGFVEESQHVVLVHYAQNRHAISTRDILLNAIVTLAVVFGSLAYRHVIAQRHERQRARRHSLRTGSRTTIQTVNTCALYRCNVRIQRVTAVSSERQAQRGLVADLSPVEGTPSGKAQLRLRQNDQVFDSSNNFFSLFSSRWRSTINQCASSHTVFPMMMYAAGLSGFLLSVLCSISYSSYTFLPGLQQPMYPILALALSSVFCSSFMMLSERRLLWKLVSSFDVIFMSFQLTTAQLCVGDFFQWDTRHLLGWSSWVWMHWAFTLDALLPITRKWLRFKLMYTMPILFVCLMTQVFFGVQIFYWRTWNVVDRVLFRLTVRSVSRELHVMPFFLSRLVTIFVGCCRMMWRIMRRKSEEDCVVLLGTVEYDYVHQRRHRHGPGVVETTTTPAVAPSPPVPAAVAAARTSHQPTDTATRIIK